MDPDPGQGSLVVEGPFYDTADSDLAITGGTGAWATARGQMHLHARNAAGSFLRLRLPRDALAIRRPAAGDSPSAGRLGHGAALNAVRNLLRKASIGQTGASAAGCRPGCQSHEAMRSKTAGSRATIEIGTSWVAPGPLTFGAGWWSPSRTSTRLGSFAFCTNEISELIEYWIDWPYDARTLS